LRSFYQSRKVAQKKFMSETINPGITKIIHKMPMAYYIFKLVRG